MHGHLIVKNPQQNVCTALLGNKELISIMENRCIFCAGGVCDLNL